MNWLAMVLLAFCSAMFSSSETALFKLGEKGRVGAPPRVRRLLADPRSLLVSILGVNLVVNLGFFAIAPSAFTRVLGGSSLGGGFLALVVLLFVGEILPKALALRAPLAIARLTAVPVSIAVGALRPARRVIESVLVFSRTALGEDERVEHGVTPEALAEVLAQSRT